MKRNPERILLVNWAGSKFRRLNWILPVLCSIPHRRFVDVCCGGGSVLLNKPQVEEEVMNDADPDIANFFQVLADDELFEQFFDRVTLLPVSRRLYHKHLLMWRERILTDRVKQAVVWFSIASQSFGGTFGDSWGFSRTNPNPRLRRLCMLLPAHQRLAGVQVTCMDMVDVVRQFDSLDTLFYVDPPYLERQGSHKYTVEASEADHQRLVEALNQVRGSFVLTGFEHPVYDGLRDCQKHSTELVVLAGRTRLNRLTSLKEYRRQEWMWIHSNQG